MGRSGAKTVRFTQVVQRSGRPEVHTLWTTPEEDGELRRAQKAHRVMTLAGRGRGKTDVGHVGAGPGEGSGQYLIFPKSLKPFEGARVVGIKFDLIAQPRLAELPEQLPSGPPRAKLRRATSAASPPAAAPAEPAPPANAAPPPPTPAEPAQRDRGGRSARLAGAPREPRPRPASAPLVRAVRAALKELQAGKSVAAYQRLERALVAEA